MNLTSGIKKESTDQFILLYLLNYAKKKNISDTSTLKVMKLLAFLKEELNIEGIQAYNLEFYKWDQGLFTKAVYPQINGLIQAGILERSVVSDDKNPPIKVTGEGEKVAEFFENLLPEDKKDAIKTHVIKVLDKYGDKTAAQLRRLNHEMEIETEKGKVKVDDLPNDETKLLIRNLAKPKKSAIFDNKLTAEWISMKAIEESSHEPEEIEQTDKSPKSLADLLKLAGR